MPAPDWLTYVGAVTGIIGAATGIVSYRRVSRMKTLELRMELRKLVADIQQALEVLPKLIVDANQSREHVRAALGTLNTGDMLIWKETVARDHAAATEMRNALQPSDGEIKMLTQSQLEDRLIGAHRLHAQIQQYTDKYRAAMAADDKDRDRHQANVRTVMSAKLGQH